MELFDCKNISSPLFFTVGYTLSHKKIIISFLFQLFRQNRMQIGLLLNWDCIGRRRCFSLSCDNPSDKNKNPDIKYWVQRLSANHHNFQRHHQLYQNHWKLGVHHFSWRDQLGSGLPHLLQFVVTTCNMSGNEECSKYINFSFSRSCPAKFICRAVCEQK